MTTPSLSALLHSPKSSGGVQKFASLWALFFLAITACGCSEGPKQYEVVGSVSYQGQMLTEGTIIFTSQDGSGATAVGNIQDGRYNVAVTAGEKVIRITASRETGRMVQGAMDQSYAERVDIIPAQYNSATTLVCTVDPVVGLEFDFHLD